MASVHKTRLRGGVWTVRITVLTALAVTLWLAGPRAFDVLSKRVGQHSKLGPKVDLDRGRLIRLPDWLRDEQEIYARILVDLEPALEGTVGIMDEDAAVTLHGKVEASPWVKRARIERVFPDRFHISFELRRPVLQLVSAGKTRWLVDAECIALPAPSHCGLPSFVLRIGIPSEFQGPIEMGAVVPDKRVWLAVASALEWRDQIAPEIDNAPRLREVDASNWEWKLINDQFLSEVVVGLETADGAVAVMQFGRPRGEGRGCGGDFETEVKLHILRQILGAHPGLTGLARGDLRLKNNWRDYLVER